MYKYHVRPTDDVGNVGEWFTYEWRTDFEAPIIEGSDSLQTNCGESFAVEVIGGQVTVSHLVHGLCHVFSLLVI